MNTRDDLSIYEFEEKPSKPKSTKASMGVYIFNWKTLRKSLKEDAADKNSNNDFGKNIIPKLLEEGKKLVAYPFQGYWKDVGTTESLWEANMDLLREDNELNIHDYNWRVYTVNPSKPAQYIGSEASVSNSLVVEGCVIYGQVENSVLFPGVYVGKNAKVKDSVLMPNVKIGDNVVINKAILGTDAIIRRDCIVGNGNTIAVIPAKEDLKSGTILKETTVQGKER